MEPEAVNTLVEEAEILRERMREEIGPSVPRELEHLFSETSLFFQEEILSIWRKSARFDELIDYILYQHEEFGGAELWKQVLLDLRLKDDEDRGHRLLDGLYPGRAKKFWAALKNYKRYPDNHLSAAACAEAKGTVMSVLYEHAFLLENKPEQEKNAQRVSLVRTRIWEIVNEKEIT